MKILLVSWSILPQSGGSSVIIENLAKNFSKEEMIVLGAKTFWQKNTIQRDERLANFRYFFSEMYLFGRGYRYFIWFRKWRFQPLVRHIEKLIRQEKIDHVIGVYPNPFYCLAACRAAKNIGVPFSCYFHNTYTENIAIIDPAAEQIQAEIFDYASHIFVMSKGMQRFYEQKYQLPKFTPLVHTFDEYPSDSSLTGIPKAGKSQYKLVAIGNFNESNLDATRRFLAAIKDHPKYQLSIYTHVPKLLLQKRGLDTSLFDYKGAVAPEAIHEVLQDCDICVLTHGFSGGYGPIEYQTIFPTRTIPFLLSGKPIFAHSPKHSFLNDFIEENKCAVLVDEPDEKKLLSALDRLVNDSDQQQELVEAARRTAHQFYGPNVAAHLKSMLSKCD